MQARGVLVVVPLLAACVQSATCEVMLQECERGLREAFEREAEVQELLDRRAESCVCLAELGQAEADDGGCAL